MNKLIIFFCFALNLNTFAQEGWKKKEHEKKVLDNFYYLASEHCWKYPNYNTRYDCLDDLLSDSLESIPKEQVYFKKYLNGYLEEWRSSFSINDYETIEYKLQSKEKFLNSCGIYYHDLIIY